MVAISLTHDSAREMANRLRQFLAAGGTSIKQTHAYEALAKSLGYRDWNTLLGALQSQDSGAKEGGTEHSPAMPRMLLLIDRNAMAAHGVTVAQIESAFRRDFPVLLDKASRWETLCYEQLPARQLPALRPPVLSLSVQAPEKAHFHESLHDCVKSVAEPKWTFAEQGRNGSYTFTFMFFPEVDLEKLLPAIREALTRLPAEITVSAVETIEPKPDHPAYGKWATDGVSYYVWAWEADTGMLLPELRQVASMALKFNGDALVRLRDVATLHVGMRAAPEHAR
jgi:hypothetical protein